MPSYSYKCDACENVERNVVHGMFESVVVPCTKCAGGQAMRILIQPVKTQIRYSMRDDCRQYRSDLARFPNDPRAYVDGPRAIQKLIDQTRREGGHIAPLSDLSATDPIEDDQDDDLLRGAQEEAIQELNEEN